MLPEAAGWCWRQGKSHRCHLEICLLTRSCPTKERDLELVTFPGDKGRRKQESCGGGEPKSCPGFLKAARKQHKPHSQGSLKAPAKDPRPALALPCNAPPRAGEVLEEGRRQPARARKAGATGPGGLRGEGALLLPHPRPEALPSGRPKQCPHPPLPPTLPACLAAAQLTCTRQSVHNGEHAACLQGSPTLLAPSGHPRPRDSSRAGSTAPESARQSCCWPQSKAPNAKP